MFEELSKSYEKLEEKHEEFMEKLCIAKEMNAEIEAEESFMNDIDSLKLVVTAAYDDIISEPDSKQVSALSAKPKIKVKPIEAPVYDGDRRKYFIFKDDYKRIMEDLYGDNPFALKQCLLGEAEKVIRGYEDNYKEMWKRLDNAGAVCDRRVNF